MSFATRVDALALRIATEVKSLRTLINGNAANLNALTTTAKGNLVLAVNELNLDKIETSLIPANLGSTQTADKLITLGTYATALGYWPIPIKFNTTSSTWPTRSSVVPGWWAGPARWEALTTVDVADPVGLQTNDVVIDLHAS